MLNFFLILTEEQQSTMTIQILLSGVCDQPGVSSSTVLSQCSSGRILMARDRWGESLRRRKTTVCMNLYLNTFFLLFYNINSVRCPHSYMFFLVISFYHNNKNWPLSIMKLFPSDRLWLPLVSLPPGSNMFKESFINNLTRNWRHLKYIK